MTSYEVESSEVENTGFGEISYDFAAATTPLSDLAGGDEPSYNINVDVHEESEEEEESDADSDEEDDEDQVQVEERIVQADGSVVIKIKSSGSHDGSSKLTKKKKSSKKKARKAAPQSSATKLTAVALHAVATAAASSGTPHAPGPIQTGQWSAGIFDCFDFCMPNCCMASFCPCVTAAQVASRVGFKYMSVLLVFGIAIALDLFLYIMTLATIHNDDTYAYYSYGYYYYYSESKTRLTAWGYIGFVLTIAVFIMIWQLRTRVRTAFQLPGSPVGDCCLSFWCSCCSLAQMATHVKSYKPGACDFGAPDELPAYNE